MNALWAERSEREQAMLIGCAVFLVLVVLVFLIIKPIVEFRSDARRDYEQAINTYEAVAQAARLQESQRSSDATSLRSVLTTSANRNNISIVRFSNQDNALDISTGAVAPGKLFVWLSTLERERNIYVREGAVRPVGDGNGVTARLTMVQR